MTLLHSYILPDPDPNNQKEVDLYNTLNDLFIDLDAIFNQSALFVDTDLRYLMLDATNSMTASTMISNLNADMLDGSHASDFLTTTSADLRYLQILATAANSTKWANQNFPALDSGKFLTNNGSTVSWGTVVTTESDPLSLHLTEITTSGHYTGFPDKTSATVPSAISWTDGSYTLTLAPSGASHYIYINGVRYTIGTLTKQLSVAQEAASGLYWFYITAPGGIPQLNCATTITDHFGQCLVATVYWNTTTSKGILSDERHWFGRDKWFHEYLHETVSARYASGLAGTFTNTTLTIGLGEFYDEDIEHTISEQTTCKVLYHNGDSDWVWDAGLTTPYKVVNPGVDNNLRYNSGNSLATVDNNKYVNYWVFATPDTTHPIHIVIGTAQYNTLALARAATVPSLGTLGTAENKLIYKITYQNNGGTPSYQEATDYRSSSNLPVANYVATDHGSLSGLSDDDHTQYVLVDGTRDMTGYGLIKGSKVELDNTSTYIDKDGSGNMTFTDAVTGTRTLKQLGCPTMKKLNATGQSAGSLNLTDTNWAVSKAWLKRLVISLASGTSSDYDVEIYEKDTFLAANKIYGVYENNTGIDIILDYIYEDQDDTDEIHIKITDNDGTGSPTFSVEIRGIELL